MPDTLQIVLLGLAYLLPANVFRGGSTPPLAGLMATSSPTIQVSLATEATDEIVAAFAKLIPQLSESAPSLDRAALAEIIAAPCNAVLLARDRTDAGRIIGALTLVVFRIPTAVRAWIEDVVVDASARGQGVGEFLTREAVSLAAKRGAQTVDLTSRPSRATARRLYERVGFTIRDTNVYRYIVPPRERHGYSTSGGREEA
jgi:ribosomal protein S18 acetylase RimI-like enzyme